MPSAAKIGKFKRVMKPAKFLLAIILLSACTRPAFGCPWCRAQVSDGVYVDDFAGTFILLLVPLALLTLIGTAIYFADRFLPIFKRRIK